MLLATDSFFFCAAGRTDKPDYVQRKGQRARKDVLELWAVEMKKKSSKKRQKEDSVLFLPCSDARWRAKAAPRVRDDVEHSESFNMWHGVLSEVFGPPDGS